MASGQGVVRPIAKKRIPAETSKPTAKLTMGERGKGKPGTAKPRIVGGKFN